MFFGLDSKKLVACAILGAFVLTLPLYGEARHLATGKEAKASLSVASGLKSVGSASSAKDALKVREAKNSGDIKSRIDALLKEKNETAKQESAKVKVKETVSAYDDSILGTPLASKEQCVSYLLSVNPSPSISVSPETLVSYYYEEGTREGVRPDVAFAQALKETGFFRYGGTVTADQNNYCGLGTTSSQVKGAYFSSSLLGVRAHIQHLLAYASTREPAEPVVDPRYELVRSSYGSETLEKWEDLNGRWAVPGSSYGQSILSMFRAILQK